MSGLSDNGKHPRKKFDLLFLVPNKVQSGSEKLAGLDAIHMGPLMSYLSNVLSQTYNGLQRYTKTCLEVMTMASPPLKIGARE
jgi:hypothetical protein